MKDLLKQAVPATVLSLCAAFAFAGTGISGSAISSGTNAYGSSNTVSQTERPSPEQCKKNPSDPRCKDGKK